MGNQESLSTDEAVETLLERASPRLAPPSEETDAVRAAVRAEWRRATGRHRARQRWTRFAIAASFLVAAVLSMNLLRTGGVEPVAVASIDKRFGAVYLSGENATLESGDDLTTIVAGQTLITGDASGLGLSWGAGGSLRIDAGSRVEFTSANSIRLLSGRVYFDSKPALAGSTRGADARLAIVTEYGEVTHVGTQYMARKDRDSVTVSVRDGEVIVEGPGFTRSAGRNQQMEISASGVHGIVNIRPHGDAWSWVEQTSPPVSLDGRSVFEFLAWVGHETGLEVRYDSPGAESYAQLEILNGTLDIGPRQALEAWLPGTSLDWNVDGGVIYVAETR